MHGCHGPPGHTLQGCYCFLVVLSFVLFPQETDFGPECEAAPPVTWQHNPDGELFFGRIVANMPPPPPWVFFVGGGSPVILGKPPCSRKPL